MIKLSEKSLMEIRTDSEQGIAPGMGDVQLMLSELAQLKAENERLRHGMKGDYSLDAWIDWTKEAKVLREEVELDNKIIAERDRLLNLFECPVHGQCVPYAMQQVAELRKEAQIGRLVFKFFDRMDDPTDCDPLEKSVGEFLAAICAAMSKGEQSRGGLQAVEKTPESLDSEGSEGGLQ